MPATDSRRKRVDRPDGSVARRPTSPACLPIGRWSRLFSLMMRAPAVLTAVRRLTRRSSGSGTVGPEEFLRAAASLLNLEELAAVATAKRADYMAAQPL